MEEKMLNEEILTYLEMNNTLKYFLKIYNKHENIAFPCV